MMTEEGGLLWHSATNKHFHDVVLREIQRRCFEAFYLRIKADADAAASLCLVLWLNEKYSCSSV